MYEIPEARTERPADGPLDVPSHREEKTHLRKKEGKKKKKVSKARKERRIWREREAHLAGVSSEFKYLR